MTSLKLALTVKVIHALLFDHRVVFRALGSSKMYFNPSWDGKGERNLSDESVFLFLITDWRLSGDPAAAVHLAVAGTRWLCHINELRY